MYGFSCELWVLMLDLAYISHYFMPYFLSPSGVLGFKKTYFLWCHSCFTGSCHFHRRDNYNILACKRPRLLFPLLILPAYDDKETLCCTKPCCGCGLLWLVCLGVWVGTRKARWQNTKGGTPLPSPALIKRSRPHPLLLLSADKTMHLKR